MPLEGEDLFDCYGRLLVRGCMRVIFALEVCIAICQCDAAFEGVSLKSKNWKRENRQRSLLDFIWDFTERFEACVDEYKTLPVIEYGSSVRLVLVWLRQSVPKH